MEPAYRRSGRNIFLSRVAGRTSVFTLFLLFFSLVVRAEFFTIRDYGVTVDIDARESYFSVEEVIQVAFTEPRHGIFRSIPYKYIRNEKDLKISIFDVEVEGFSFKTYKEGSQFYIKIGDKDVFVEGTQTYRIRYKVKKAYLYEEGHTEFYWNLIGHEWQTGIDSIHFSVQFSPSVVVQEADYGVVTGFFGDRGGDVAYSYDGQRLTGHSLRAFQSGEGVTAFIRLPLTYIERPGPAALWWEKYGDLVIALFLFLPLAGGFFWLWWRYGKDYPLVDVVEFRPPDGITPAEAGMLMDDTADNRDIITLLPYWASRGYLSIEHIEKKWAVDDYQLVKCKSLPVDAPDYERVVFEAIFESGDSIVVSGLRGKFHQTLTEAKQLLKKRVISRGVYYPDSLRIQKAGVVFAFLVLLAALGSFFFLGNITIGISLFFASLLGFFFSYHMMKKNKEGFQLYQKVRGFKTFVTTAEKDKLERMLKEDPMYFESTLPYAMVFGYAKVWSKKFDGLLVEPPHWYHSTGTHFRGMHGFSSFGSSLEDTTRSIGSAFATVPGGNGGSGGGGGGGFSGGGFGGGGGGSW